MGKTSWKVKDRYNKKVYGSIYVMLPKDLVTDFKAKCSMVGISQAQVVREAIERFLEK